MAATWRTMPGHPAYEVSASGIVRRRLPGLGTFVGRVLTQCSSREYRYVCMDGERVFVHVAVCRAFHGPKPGPQYEAAHMNGRNTDNRRSNLRWLTQRQNDAHKDKHGTRVRGARHHKTNLTPKDVRRIRRLAETKTQLEIGAIYGIQQPAVSRIINRIWWKHVK